MIGSSRRGTVFLFAIPVLLLLVSTSAPYGSDAALPAGVRSVDPRDDFEVESYQIDLELDPSVAEVRGIVTLVLRPVTDLPRVRLDLRSPLEIDLAWTSGGTAPVQRIDDEQVDIVLPTSWAIEAPDTLHLRYRGRPVDASGRSLFQEPMEPGGSISFVSPAGPGAASRWFPCKDLVADKAQVRIRVSAPESMEASATGVRLTREPGPDATAVTVFQTLFPCAVDWVALHAGVGVTGSALYRSAESGLEIPLLFHAAASDSARAFALWRRMALPDTGALAVLEQRFGPYPFADTFRGIEPFRMAEIPEPALLPGQSMGRQGARWLRDPAEARDPDGAVASLLARQWFGAAVTPEQEGDRWLTDGFAAYAEALLAEARGGSEAYRAAMERLHRDAFARPVAVRDAGFPGSPRSSPGSNAEADSAQMEAASLKAAWVLHSLRWVLRNLRPEETHGVAPGRGDAAGVAEADETFFRILRGFASSGLYRMGSAAGDDFVRFAEETAQADLHWFFGPWLFGTGRPHLAWDWSADSTPAGGSVVRLHLEEAANDLRYPAGEPYPASPDMFPIFWDVLLEGPQGVSTRQVVHQTARAQDFTLTAGHAVVSVRLDPDHWILRTLEAIPRRAHVEVARLRPNPSSGHILYRVADAQGGESERPFDLTIFDVSGRRVRRLVSGLASPGSHVTEWNGVADDGTRAAQGIYFIRATQGAQSDTRRLMLLRR